MPDLRVISREGRLILRAVWSHSGGATGDAWIAKMDASLVRASRAARGEINAIIHRRSREKILTVTGWRRSGSTLSHRLVLARANSAQRKLRALGPVRTEQTHQRVCISRIGVSNALKWYLYWQRNIPYTA